MNSWERIPREQMITVSRRKFMRLKASVDWKVAEKFRIAEKRLIAERDAARKEADVAQNAYLASELRMMEWFDAYNAKSKELACYLLAQKELV